MYIYIYDYLTGNQLCSNLLLHCICTAATLLIHRCCNTAAKLLLHRCYIAATPLLHRCYTAATPLLHRCYTAATPLLHRCYTAATPVLHRCYTAATPLLHRCYTDNLFTSYNTRHICLFLCFMKYIIFFHISQHSPSHLSLTIIRPPPATSPYPPTSLRLPDMEMLFWKTLALISRV